MGKIKYVVLLLLLMNKAVVAQHAHFVKSGTITYEKIINMHAIFKKNADAEHQSDFIAEYEDYKKHNPQFKRLKSDLNFGANKTLFAPIEEDTNDLGFNGNQAMIRQHNIVFTDLNAKRVIIQKQIFEQIFLVKDSMRKINWKITDETRVINGYTCRRANALILDSIYVVAFYTSQIPIPGGPESFNGLPGMILEVALPHENIRWLAISVTDMTINDNQIAAPNKGRQVSRLGLQQVFDNAKKDWGNNTQILLKAFSF